ncbi:unnamed protein product, partial [Fusarium fujikuroi]
PSALSDQDKSHIKILIKNNPFISYRDIISRARLRASPKTIRHWLIDEKIQHRLALRRPNYTKWSFYRARLLFQKLLLTTPQGERLHKDKVQARRRPIRHSQIFYSAINYNKPSTVVPLPGDPESERGGVTGRRIL